ncbi:hypothetical protein E1N52_04455 [Paraburkholderia guartelaensis]|uniref:Uncharacterized protein n=1 Tax=Paraburkholderia guartelaensis TaxID=2546446 RepID=A0A4R5LJP3_9BURK|nr:hypothetical protein [Paraburkholderia guartelaensis]TDG09783.1 hypothetical protein E1N52_04455 [Paraburkholderia guartelaensis]
MIHDYDLSVILPRLSGPLRELLDAELSIGNTMVEISSGWPMPNVNVWLKNPLSRKYLANYPDLEYAYLGDPRNWLEHYIDTQIGAMVAAEC